MNFKPSTVIPLHTQGTLPLPTRFRRGNNPAPGNFEVLGEIAISSGDFGNLFSNGTIIPGTLAVTSEVAEVVIAPGWDLPIWVFCTIRRMPAPGDQTIPAIGFYSSKWYCSFSFVNAVGTGALPIYGLTNGGLIGKLTFTRRGREDTLPLLSTNKAFTGIEGRVQRLIDNGNYASYQTNIDGPYIEFAGTQGLLGFPFNPPAIRDAYFEPGGLTSFDGYDLVPLFTDTIGGSNAGLDPIPVRLSIVEQLEPISVEGSFTGFSVPLNSREGDLTSLFSIVNNDPGFFFGSMPFYDYQFKFLGSLVRGLIRPVFGLSPYATQQEEF